MTERFVPQETVRVDDFNRAVNQGIDEAIASIEPLDYHNGYMHTPLVIARSVAILHAINEAEPSMATTHDVGIATLSAAYHDVVQEYEEDPVFAEGITIVKRKRKTIANERKSAARAIDFMNRINDERGEIFTLQDELSVFAAIAGTIPEFSLEHKTVVQPYLTPQSGVIALSVGLADIGSAGMDPNQFLLDGDNLFREENMDMVDILDRMDSLSDHEKDFHRRRMLGWSSFQCDFAMGQKAILPGKIAHLSSRAQANVAKLFSHFDESFCAATEVTQKREQMQLRELLTDYGYRPLAAAA